LACKMERIAYIYYSNYKKDCYGTLWKTVIQSLFWKLIMISKHKLKVLKFGNFH
jgi:hypothetical protein